MSKIALSVDQMKHLEALGIDTSRASMSYLCVSGEWELRYADAACREVFSQDYRPAFILSDLFDVLPPVIRRGDVVAPLHVLYLQGGRVHVYYGPILAVPVCGSLLNALYSLLCAVAETFPEVLSLTH